jgi:hypothetical protein
MLLIGSPLVNLNNSAQGEKTKTKRQKQRKQKKKGAALTLGKYE